MHIQTIDLSDETKFSEQLYNKMQFINPLIGELELIALPRQIPSACNCPSSSSARTFQPVAGQARTTSCG
jgi:hypothetical protein